MKDYLECRSAKIEVLMNYWEKVEFQILRASAPNTAKGKKRDEDTEAFALKVGRVPARVRHALLKAFV